MKKVAMFDNTGGSKSTLGSRLAEIAGLPLHVLDEVQYRVGGERTSSEKFKLCHQDSTGSGKYRTAKACSDVEIIREVCRNESIHAMYTFQMVR